MNIENRRHNYSHCYSLSAEQSWRNISNKFTNFILYDDSFKSVEKGNQNFIRLQKFHLRKICFRARILQKIVCFLEFWSKNFFGWKTKKCFKINKFYLQKLFIAIKDKKAKKKGAKGNRTVRYTVKLLNLRLLLFSVTNDNSGYIFCYYSNIFLDHSRKT